MKCSKCNADVMVLFNYGTEEKGVCIECYDVPGDLIVDSVLNKYNQRAKIGYAKYKTNMMRDDLNTLQWLTHLQEELMDATLYIEKLQRIFKHESWDDIHFRLSEQGYYDKSDNME